MDEREVPKADWIQKIIQKSKKSLESEETRRMLQLMVLDPFLNYLLERIFPYVIVICVMFTVLTVLLTAVLILLFMRVPTVWKT